MKIRIIFAVFALSAAALLMASCAGAGRDGVQVADGGATASGALYDTESAENTQEERDTGEITTDAGTAAETDGEDHMSNVENLLEKITVNKQSSIRIETDKIIYLDPFGLTGALHDADIIFITHAHYDHFSPEDIEKAANAGTVFVIPASMKGDLADLGIESGRVNALLPGESATIEGFEVETVPAYNIDKSYHPKSNGWLGYIITVGGVRVYAAGDTDATDEAKSVRCDIAFLPIGGKYTMDASEARELARIIAPAAAIPTHYGSIVGSPSDYDVFADGLDFAVEKLVF